MRNKIAFFLALLCLSWQLPAQPPKFVFPTNNQTVIIDTAECTAKFFWNCDQEWYMQVQAKIATMDQQHLTLWDYDLRRPFQLTPTVKACLVTCPWHAVSGGKVNLWPSQANIVRRE